MKIKLLEEKMGKTVIKFVKKRDGRIVPFDKEKIAEAIFKAAQSVGGENKYLAEETLQKQLLFILKKTFRAKPLLLKKFRILWRGFS